MNNLEASLNTIVRESQRRSKRFAIYYIAALAVILLVFIAGLRLASAHDWYDRDCCHNEDCGPVPTEEVEELSDGDWKHIPTGAVFKKSEGRVRPSHDNHFHVCIGNAEHNKGRAYCIYILQGT